MIFWVTLFAAIGMGQAIEKRIEDLPNKADFFIEHDRPAGRTRVGYKGGVINGRKGGRTPNESWPMSATFWIDNAPNARADTISIIFTKACDPQCFPEGIKLALVGDEEVEIYNAAFGRYTDKGRKRASASFDLTVEEMKWWAGREDASFRFGEYEMSLTPEIISGLRSLLKLAGH